MVSIYLDDCLQARRLVRQLRAAGHLLYLPSELNVEGQDDELHLIAATERGAVLVTHNQHAFADLDDKWREAGRVHTGIILVVQDEYIATKIACVERAARLLTPEAARGQRMPLQMFGTEQRAVAYIASLTPGAS